MPRSCNTGLCLPEEVEPGRELHQPEHDPGGRVRDGAAADDAAGAGGVRGRRGQGQQQRRHAAAAPHRAHRHRGAPRLHPLHRFTTQHCVEFNSTYYDVSFEGTSINPARSFGPALIKNQWADHWVFWLGPMLGGALAGVLYKIAFFNKKDDL